VNPGAIRALITALLLMASPVTAGAQVFLASRPNPDFMVGPLFVRIAVTPELGVTLDVLWSLMVPPSKSGGAIAQDLYLLWPNSVGVSSEGAPDPALAAYVTARGFTPIKEGRLPLFAQSLYRGEEVPPQPVKGTTTYEDVLRIGGGEPEEHEQLATPDRRTVFYRGSRIVPQQRRRFGWLATVGGWSVEQHEVEITLDRNVVADVQARVRRSPLPPAASG
jgi:hypothetical protein